MQDHHMFAIKEAHRQVPIVARDWKFFGWQMEAGAHVYINKVVTFGVTSASYHWSRVASAFQCRHFQEGRRL